jgi:putative PIN family toxin of toxin-antitoxin system
MQVVLDTNILVSALLSPFGSPARVLDLVLTDEVQLVYDDRIMAEYREVLARPRFAFEPARVADVLELLEHHGFSVIARPLRCELPDPDDLPFLEAAAQTGATLVTGNMAHYPPSARGAVEALSPAQFVARYLNQTRSV